MKQLEGTKKYLEGRWCSKAHLEIEEKTKTFSVSISKVLGSVTMLQPQFYRFMKDGKELPSCWRIRAMWVIAFRHRRRCGWLSDWSQPMLRNLRAVLTLGAKRTIVRPRPPLLKMVQINDPDSRESLRIYQDICQREQYQRPIWYGESWLSRSSVLAMILKVLATSPDTTTLTKI